MHTATLHALLERVTNGDEEALLQLHAEFNQLVYSVAYHTVQNQMDAEEVAQDVFLKLWHKVETYDPAKGRFVTWLLTITRHTAIDRVRRRRQQTLPLEEWDAPHDNALDNDLADALRTLNDEQRQAIYLAYFQGLSHTQIAEQLGRPLGTVKTHLRQGMDQLRHIWLRERVPHE